LCSSLVFLAVFMLLLVVWAPCAPCLFLVLFACILGGFHAPPCRVSSLCSLPVPCALRLYFRRYSCSFILQARGRPLQIAVARSDSSSGCAVTRPCDPSSSVPTVSQRTSGSPCGAARTPLRVWPRQLAPATAPSSRRPATVPRRRPDRTSLTKAYARRHRVPG
jgi:hypothetical protein